MRSINIEIPYYVLFNIEQKIGNDIRLAPDKHTNTHVFYYIFNELIIFLDQKQKKSKLLAAQMRRTLNKFQK